MMLIGLTGPTGAGKGTASAIFRKYGIPSIDADKVYHELLLNPESPCTQALASAFGKGILCKNGCVDRKKLAGMVFGHPDTPNRLHKLNTLTHTYIMAKVKEMTEKYRKEGARAVLLDAPQLFEAGADRECDRLIAVLSEKEKRLSRILARDGLSAEAAEKRIFAQQDDSFFRARCPVILENNGSVAELEEKIKAFLLENGLL